MAKRKPKVVLIDGDLLLFRAAVAVEKTVRWDDENHVLFANEEDAWPAVVAGVQSLLDRFETKESLIAFTQGPVFRLQVSPTYKSNRAGSRKPLCYSALKQRMEETYRCISFPGLEADDVLGIFASRDQENTVLCSADKDMQGVPCVLFDGAQVRRISQEEADYFHLYQTLVGDTADGYPGCPGVGPKKAAALLDNPTKTPVREFWRMAVVPAYEKAGLTEADALIQARLARILRSSDWDAEKKQPILWTPSTNEGI